MVNKRALLKLGWTPVLIEAILGKPDQVEQHKHGFKRWTEHLYLQSRVDAGMADPRFLQTIAKRKQRIAAVEKRRREIPQRYVTWQAALPEACAAMKQLNRYAKHRVCSAVQKVEIYQLKNEFVEMLYRAGYCTAAWIHVQQLAEQRCRECAGDGEFCNHCGGTGVWREARTIELWCFNFAIGRQMYCWHQPIGLVNFKPVASVPPQDFQGVPHEKPVTLPKHRFAAVKELIRWVIDAAAAGEAQPQEPGAVTSQEADMLPFDPAAFEASSHVFASAEQPSLFSGVAA